MEESIDELMMMVSSETKWTLGDMLGMDIIKFVKVVHSVQAMIKARNEEMKKKGGGKKG